MQELIFASNNQNKIKELQASIGHIVRIIGLKEAGIEIDIDEPFDTIRANASEKSRVINSLTKHDCFSEDTGLEVDALHGAPGVHSARYAGEPSNAALNIEKLMEALKGNPHRQARFRTVISLRMNELEYFFEGVAEGNIITGERGANGFGYDPVFIPLGCRKTFAEMSIDEKAQYSHRRKAGDKLVLFLHKQHLAELQAMKNENETH